MYIQTLHYIFWRFLVVLLKPLQYSQMDVFLYRIHLLIIQIVILQLLILVVLFPLLNQKLHKLINSPLSIPPYSPTISKNNFVILVFEILPTTFVMFLSLSVSITGIESTSCSIIFLAANITLSSVSAVTTLIFLIIYNKYTSYIR